jgi:hypothetical protein
MNIGGPGARLQVDDEAEVIPFKVVGSAELPDLDLIAQGRREIVTIRILQNDMAEV